MEHIPEDDILQLSINAFKTIGESMAADTTHAILNVYRFINMVVMGITITPIVANLFHVEPAMYIQTIEGLFSVIHISVKYVPFLYYKCDIVELLRGVVHFWKRCDLKINKEYNDNISRAYKVLNPIQYFFSAGTVSIIVALLLKPAFSKSIYVFDCWVPDSIVLETVVLLSQYYFICFGAYTALPFDLMYVTYSVHVIIQLRLLKHKLKHLGVRKDVLVMHSCIKHHQFLLSIVKRMNRVYAWMFLFQYFVTLITGCTQLYVIILGHVDMIELIATTGYIIMMTIEFAYWCFPAEEIAFQLSNISTAIYMSSWYREDRIVIKAQLIMMMRAQSQKYMSAGGLMEMNIDAFGSVMRKVFSFYAILRNVLNK